jgi:hypothetical protein
LSPREGLLQLPQEAAVEGLLQLPQEAAVAKLAVAAAVAAG